MSARLGKKPGRILLLRKKKKKRLSRPLTWIKWFWITSRTIPNLSKYPPRPEVPNGSLNVIWTLAMCCRDHAGDSSALANLRNNMFCISSLPR